LSRQIKNISNVNVFKQTTGTYFKNDDELP